MYMLLIYCTSVVHVAHIISQVQAYSRDFSPQSSRNFRLQEQEPYYPIKLQDFLSSVFWLVHMVDALATKSCMNMQAFYFQLMSYPKEMKFIIPSNANNMGCDSVAMVTTNLAWKVCHPCLSLGLCCLLCSLYQAASRQTPMSACSSKTDKLVKRWNSDVHMSRFGNCWQSCVAGHTNKLTKRWNFDVHMDRFGNCWQSCVAGQCSGECSFLQDKVHVVSLPNVMVPELHQSNCCYVCVRELSNNPIKQTH